MTERERAYQPPDEIPAHKIPCSVGYTQGLTISDKKQPNRETFQAMRELERGSGEIFKGSAGK